MDSSEDDYMDDEIEVDEGIAGIINTVDHLTQAEEQYLSINLDEYLHNLQETRNEEDRIESPIETEISTEVEPLLNNLSFDILLDYLSSSLESNNDEECLVEVCKFGFLSDMIKHTQNFELQRMIFDRIIQLMQQCAKKMRKQYKTGLLNSSTIVTLHRYCTTLSFIVRSSKPWIQKSDVKKIQCIENFLYTPLPFSNVAMFLTNIRLEAFALTTTEQVESKVDEEQVESPESKDEPDEPQEQFSVSIFDL